MSAFQGAGLSTLNNWESGSECYAATSSGTPLTFSSIAGVISGSAAVFVATHDSERGSVGGSLSYNNNPNNAYQLAHVFMLAYPYGTPTVLSSYQFSNTDAGAPNGGKFSNPDSI
jgi:hypothetical protein